LQQAIQNCVTSSETLETRKTNVLQELHEIIYSYMNY